jgi:tetratricopeptide (TPR) repeat protein
MVGVVVSVLWAGLGGCASRRATGEGPGGYLESYTAGRYSEAYDRAARAAASGTSEQRDRASLYAGLSAQAINRNDDARRWLEPLVDNRDAVISGSAGAALGLIAAEQNRHDEAARLLSTSSAKLTGNEAARAALYAGDSYRALARTSEARAMYERAAQTVGSDTALRLMIADRLNAPPPPSPSRGGWTVQVGAFSNLRNAQVLADRFRSRGQVWVVEVTSRTGQKLHAVRVGQYASRAQADAAARQMGQGARAVSVSER